MEKIKGLVLFFGVFVMLAPCFAVDVTTGEEFVNAYNDSNVSEINLKNDIVIEGDFSQLNRELNIYGGNHIIDGNSKEGFNVYYYYSTSLNILGENAENKVILQNFASDSLFSSGAHVTLKNTIIRDNLITGIAMFETDSSRINLIEDVDFSNNVVKMYDWYALININGGTIDTFNRVTFENNNANVIYNENDINNFKNSSIINNAGYAIKNDPYYSFAQIGIIADENDVIISGNGYGTNESVGIINAGYKGDNGSKLAEIHLRAFNDNKIVINDIIKGSDELAVNNSMDMYSSNKKNAFININNEYEYYDENSYSYITVIPDGIVEINNSVYDNTINLYNGTLKLGSVQNDNNADLHGVQQVGNLTDNVDLYVYNGKLSTQDGAINSHNLGNLNFDNDDQYSSNPNSILKYDLDVDLHNGTIDNLTVTSTEQGTIVIDNINVVGGEYTSDYNYEYSSLQVLNLPDSSLTLSLSDELQQKSDNGEVFFGNVYYDYTDSPILENSNWQTTKYYRYADVYKKYGSIFIFSNQTDSDSLIFSGSYTDYIGYELIKTFDTLAFVNQSYDLSEKNFNFDTENDIYIVTEDLGETQGILNINGIKNNDNLSTIDLNGHSGFEVNDRDSINLSNVIIRNALNNESGSALYLNSDVVHNFQNINFLNNQISKTQGIQGKYTDEISVYAYSYGGAMSNYQKIATISDVEFLGNRNNLIARNIRYSEDIGADNTYHTNADARGGAIYNAGGATISEISNVSFVDNIASAHVMAGLIDNPEFAVYRATNSIARGGAIYNIGVIENITNTSFEDNYVSSIDEIVGYCPGSSAFFSQDGGGGAIYNKSQIKNLSNLTFINNHAMNESRYGGAIYNEGTIDVISDTIFENNSAEQGGAIHNGGGFYNNGTIKIIKNSVFKNNSAEQYGAIRTRNNLTIIDSQFISNNAVKESESNRVPNEAEGGAIGNSGTLNLVALNNDFIMSGNYKKNVLNKGKQNESLTLSSEAIYNSSVLNLNAGDKSIIINDGINGSGTNSKININPENIDISDAQDGSVFAPNNGNIEINNTISSSTVNLINGTLKFGTYTYDNSAPVDLQGQTGVGGLANNADLVVQGGKISTQDGQLNVHNLGNIKFDTTLNPDKVLNVEMDLDIINQTSDKFTVASSESGYMIIKDIDSLGINYDSVSINDTFELQIINGTDDNLQLGLYDEENNIVSSKAFAVAYKYGNQVDDVISENTNWQDVYYTKRERDVKYTDLTLKSTTTLNDSVVLSFREEYEPEVIEALNTLTYVNTSDTLSNKNFNFDTENDVYVVQENLGLTKNTVNINGVRNNDSLSKIDLNNKSGFELADSNSRLNLKNVEVSNGFSNRGSVINVTNQDAVVVIEDSVIKNNSSNNNGGALYNQGTIEIIANNSDVIIENNTSNHSATPDNNAIHNAGTINLSANDNKKVVINDKISGNSGTININQPLTISNPIGTVAINNEVKNNTINLNGGVLSLGSYGNNVGSFDSSVNFNIHGGHITTIDNQINNHNLGNVTLNSNLTMSLDANLNTEKIDTISMDSFSNPNSSTIDINKINIIEPTTKQQLELSLFDSNMDQTTKENVSNSIVYSGGEIAYSPIYKYDVDYDNTQGNFKFTSLASSNSSSNSSNFNPSVLSTPTSTQLGGFTTQINTYNEAFSNMDMFMARDVNERIMMKYADKYASNTQNNNDTIIDSSLSSDINYDEYLRRNNREGWLRPYVTFEKVPLKNGPKVTNIGYGSYFGANSKLYSLKRGWDASWGGYFGYLGSRQTYDNVTTNQNGATVGLVGELYKNNFFTGLTINTGASMGKSHTMYGEDNFEMLTAGVASKSGYNFEFKKGKYIIQPNFLASYSFVNTFDYTTKSGVKIKSDPLNAIQIEPGLKFIANLENGWKPYAQVSMIWNFLDKTDVKANDVKLPEMSIKPYVRYGVGLQKSWKDKFSGFTQAFVTNGGRNGVGLQAGFSWRI